MYIIYGIIIILFLFAFILKYLNKQQNIEIKNEKYVSLENYTSNGYIMTQTELNFYRELRKVTDKLDYIIFPQINLERLISVKNNSARDRNRIKSRSIDYAIVNNKNCKIICCIELDDYTHNKTKAIETDNFKNELFKKVNIPLYRIKVSNYYNLDKIEEIIKGENISPSTF